LLKLISFSNLKMYCKGFFTALFGLVFVVLNAQYTDTVFVNNGSFEDIPRNGGDRIPISGWYDCGVLRFPNESPPDIHPGGFWENEVKAAHGKTYLGMVVRDNDSYEGVGQRLTKVLERGKCYDFSLQLAQSSKYWSQSKLTNQKANYIRPCVIRIWGGNGFCTTKELLAESPAINHEEWKTYDFTCKPKEDYRYILIEAYYKTPVILPYNGHLLLDKMSHFYERSCEKDVAQSEDKKIQDLPPHKRTRVENAVRKSENSVASKEETKKDNQETAVVKNEPPKKKILEELDIQKIKPGSTIEIKNLYFKADSSNFSSNSIEVLDELVGFLKNFKTVYVEIGGHTNGLCETKFCDQLSAARAKSVYNYLVNEGIDTNRLTYVGYGKRKKIAADTTPQGRSKNQRVEVKVISI
jgi:outer membrane protein OmpA-like peptidoglycan-associated protein